MPRLPRIEVEGAIYYVTSKAVQNEVIFKDKEDYKMYLDLVSKYKTQHKFKLYSYCLLPERLELLIETGEDASISEIMHDLNNFYTKYFNTRYDRRGHLFESRFRSVLIEKANHLLALTRHIHRAPWREAKNTGTPLREYPYSSFLLYFSPEISDEAKEALQFLNVKDDPAAYEKYVIDGDKKEIALLEKGLRRGSVFGSEDFQQQVKKKLEEHAAEAQKEAKAKKADPVLIYFIGGLVIVATAASAYLYVSKSKVQSEYQALLESKETEFSEKTRFENRSPLAPTELDGTEWRIEAVPAPRGGEVRQDRIAFEDGLFRSETLGAEGFRASKYVLVPQGSGIVLWQSTQTNSAGDTASWSGTWQGDAMKGLYTLIDASGRERSFSFFSSAWTYKAEGGAR